MANGLLDSRTNVTSCTRDVRLSPHSVPRPGRLSGRLSASAERFAEYQVGAWQVPIIGTIAYSVGAAYTPELVRHFQNKEPERALELWQRGIHKTSLLVLPVTMALVIGAVELVTVLYTEAYRDAASVFRFYSVLTFLRVATYGSMIVAAGRPHLAMRAAAVGVSANFVFGIADISGGLAVISLSRLRANVSASTFMARAMKEIFHELGHAFGLGHCANSRCVMHFSNSLADSDVKDEQLCAACVQRMQAQLSPQVLWVQR